MFVEAAISLICFVGMLLGATWVGGLIVFAPLHERTLLFKVDGRFRIADVVGLAVLMQLCIGLLVALTPSQAIEFRIAASIVLFLVVTLWWVQGLRMLSRAGVTNGLQRGAFLAIVMPLGYVSILGVLGSLVMLPVGVEGLNRVRDRDLLNFLASLLFVSSPMVSVATCYACNSVCRRMATRARDEQAKRDGINFGQMDESRREPWVPTYLSNQPPTSINGVWLEAPVVRATLSPEEVAKSTREDSGTIDFVDESGE